MTQRSDQQRWALDTLLANGGFDVLHPGAEFVLTQFGYDAADFQRVVEPAKAVEIQAQTLQQIYDPQDE